MCSKSTSGSPAFFLCCWAISLASSSLLVMPVSLKPLCSSSSSSGQTMLMWLFFHFGPTKIHKTSQTNLKSVESLDSVVFHKEVKHKSDKCLVCSFPPIQVETTNGTSAWVPSFSPSKMETTSQTSIWVCLFPQTKCNRMGKVKVLGLWFSPNLNEHRRQPRPEYLFPCVKTSPYQVIRGGKHATTRPGVVLGGVLPLYVKHSTLLGKPRRTKT